MEQPNMKSPENSETALHFKVRCSKIALGMEILLHVLVLISLTQLFSNGWLVVFVFLFSLFSIRFFKNESVMNAFPAKSSIELRHTPPSLIWYDQYCSNSYAPGDFKLWITRWFVLLDLGRGCSCRRKLLLADSFDDINHYTRFRRQLIEMTL